MAGKNKIMQAVVSFAGTIDPSLGKAMDNVAGHLDKVNWKAVAVGAAVGGICMQARSSWAASPRTTSPRS